MVQLSYVFYSKFGFCPYAFTLFRTKRDRQFDSNHIPANALDGIFYCCFFMFGDDIKISSCFAYQGLRSLFSRKNPYLHFAILSFIYSFSPYSSIGLIKPKILDSLQFGTIKSDHFVCLVLSMATKRLEISWNNPFAWLSSSFVDRILSYFFTLSNLLGSSCSSQICFSK